MRKTAKHENTSFEYEAEELSIYELPTITHDDAQYILFRAKELLDELEIDFYLGYGTLLGAVRDKDFIAGDLDVDIVILEEEKLFKSLPFLEEQGFMLIRWFEHSTYSFRSKEKPQCYIDFYIQKSIRNIFNPWAWYCYHLGATSYVPKKLIMPLSKIQFLGREFCIPGQTIKYLEFMYTETWNEPIGKFDKVYRYTVPSHYVYKRVTKSIRNFIKEILRYIIGDTNFEKLKTLIKGK